jgi:catenin alpha
VAKGQVPPGGQSSYEGPGELAAAMDEFDASLIINPLTYDEVKNRQILEESLESIISGAALLADSRYTISVITSQDF